MRGFLQSSTALCETGWHCYDLLVTMHGCTAAAAPAAATAVAVFGSLQLSAAAAYFGLDDGQKDTYLGGYLMAAFFIVGAPAALAVRPQ